MALAEFFLLVVELGAVKTARGLAILEDGRAGLNDAWAVLTDTEEVGCPEAKIDLPGVLKRLL